MTGEKFTLMQYSVHAILGLIDVMMEDTYGKRVHGQQTGTYYHYDP